MAAQGTINPRVYKVCGDTVQCLTLSTSSSSRRRRDDNDDHQDTLKIHLNVHMNKDNTPKQLKCINFPARKTKQMQFNVISDEQAQVADKGVSANTEVGGEIAADCFMNKLLGSDYERHRQIETESVKYVTLEEMRNALTKAMVILKDIQRSLEVYSKHGSEGHYHFASNNPPQMAYTPPPHFSNVMTPVPHASHLAVLPYSNLYAPKFNAPSSIPFSVGHDIKTSHFGTNIFKYGPLIPFPTTSARNLAFGEKLPTPPSKPVPHEVIPSRANGVPPPPPEPECDEASKIPTKLKVQGGLPARPFLEELLMRTRQRVAEKEKPEAVRRSLKKFGEGSASISAASSDRTLEDVMRERMKEIREKTSMDTLSDENLNQEWSDTNFK